MKVIRTERLLLTRYSLKDNESFISLVTDKTVMDHVDQGALSKSKAERLWSRIHDRTFAKNVWAVFLLADDEYIGHSILTPRSGKPGEWEIGFVLRKCAWGKGYATEIAKVIIKFGFDDLRLSSVYATVDEDHKGSINVLKKSGMKFLRYEYDKLGRYSVYRIKR